MASLEFGRSLPASPCIGICDLDIVTGRCLGCARTGDEIARWRDGGDAFREAVWAELPARIAAQGLNIRRLAWDTAAILDFVEDTLRGSRGMWMFGLHGAAARVTRDGGEPLTITRDAGFIEALTPRAALRITALPGLRALGWREKPDTPERIVLALPRIRLGEPGPSSLTPLGPDTAALMPAGKEQPRFDLGLGHAAARYTLRVGDSASRDIFEAAVGAPSPVLQPGIAGMLGAAGLTHVIETPLGRAEIASQGQPSASAYHAEPSTDLRPGLLAEGRATPPALHLPQTCVMGCLFYPNG